MTRRAHIPLFIATLLMPALALCAEPAKKASTQDTRATLSRISSEKKQTTADLAAAKSQYAALQKQLRDVELNISKSVAAIRKTRLSIDKTASQLAQLEKKHETQSSALARHKAHIADQLTRRYAMARIQRIAVVADAEDASALARRLHHLDTLTAALTRQAESLEQNTTELRDTRSEIQRQQSALEVLRNEQTQQLADLKKQAQEQQRIATSLASLIENKSAQLNTLSDDEKRLKATLERLARSERAKKSKSAANKAFPEALRGQFDLPVDGPVLRGFGSTASTGRPQQGLLIGATSGEEVRAVGDGEVVFADWMRGYGMLLIVDHGDNVLSLYGQNESLLKSVGERVRKGEAIASAGQSGGQSKPGVYFEMRLNGKPIDPYLVLRR